MHAFKSLPSMPISSRSPNSDGGGSCYKKRGVKYPHRCKSDLNKHALGVSGSQGLLVLLVLVDSFKQNVPTVASRSRTRRGDVCRRARGTGAAGVVSPRAG